MQSRSSRGAVTLPPPSLVIFPPLTAVRPVILVGSTVVNSGTVGSDSFSQLKSTNANSKSIGNFNSVEYLIAMGFEYFIF